jgi:uncharacterized membrane protein
VTTEGLLTVIALVCVTCLTLERRVAWLAHISGVCLIITVALFLATLGLIPSAHPVYDFFTGPTIPIALALMVLSLDYKELIRIPRSLMVVYVFGVAGTVLGAVLATVLAARALGMDAALLAAQFSASYIGGGENAVAMQKILNIPNELFVAGFAIDNLLTSAWMVMTLAFARSKPVELETAEANQAATRVADDTNVNMIDMLVCIAAAFIAHGISIWLSRTVGFLHPILYLTLVAFLLGQIPFVKLRVKPAYLLGSLLFAAFFFSIGAISDLRALVGLHWQVMLMPLVVVAVHGVIIYGAGHYFRVPTLMTSLASQSLIGGPSTAVALAQARGWKSGVSLGLIAGVLGYAIANYFGFGVYQLAARIVGAMN